MSNASRALVLSAALAVLTIGDARAADQSAASISSSGSEKLQEVAVTALRAKLMPRVRKFVNQIVAPENNGEDGIARWKVPPVCPLVSGLTRRDGEFILARLSDMAREAGVPLADEHCSPNPYILVATQPEELLRGMEKRNRPFTFGYDRSDYPPIETPPYIVDTFIKTPRAVRVWYNSDQKDPWGQPLAYCRLHGVRFGQLAAYVAMVGFAKVKPGAKLRDAPTILKLFDGKPEAAPAGLTDWDRAFLKSLYATNRLVRGQSGQIARAMVRDIVH